MTRKKKSKDEDFEAMRQRALRPFKPSLTDEDIKEFEEKIRQQSKVKPADEAACAEVIKQCDKMNYVFFHFITKKTPYLVYKYAMTLDGKTCTCTSKSKWISNEHRYASIRKKRYLS